MKTLLLAAVALAIVAPAGAAFADDRYDRDREHRRDHRAYEREHRHAHEHGFDSRREHRAYHRELKADHRDDHRAARRAQTFGVYGYAPYPYVQGGYSYDPGYGYAAPRSDHRRW